MFCAQFFDPSFLDGVWWNPARAERTQNPKFYDIVHTKQRTVMPHSRESTKTRLLAKRLVQAAVRYDAQIENTKL